MQSIDHDIESVGLIDIVPRILDTACSVTGLGFATIARVTEAQWVACAVLDQCDFGLKSGDELDVGMTFCDTVRRTGRIVVFNDALADPAFRNHPVSVHYGIRSYISVPIHLPNGDFFGTLCALGTEPGEVDTEQIVNTFSLFAELVGIRLDTHQQHEETRGELADERQRGALREQFVAILGHDLRNPLGAIRINAALLQQEPAERLVEIGRSTERGVARMIQLIENLLDFAQARLGGGIGVDKVRGTVLAPQIEQVIAEFRSIHPEREIHAELGALGTPLYVDGGKIAQVVGNLAGNALQHGNLEGPVWIESALVADTLEISVKNLGGPVPEEIRERFFQPFMADRGDSRQKGLGLGLYIAAEIAKAHGGTLEALESSGAMRFVCRIPQAR